MKRGADVEALLTGNEYVLPQLHVFTTSHSSIHQIIIHYVHELRFFCLGL
jgi:hypothetical protein